MALLHLDLGSAPDPPPRQPPRPGKVELLLHEALAEMVD